MTFPNDISRVAPTYRRASAKAPRPLNPLHSTQPTRLVGALIGGLLAYSISCRLETVPTCLLSSLALVGGSSLCGSPRLSPGQLWSLIGACTGALLGSAVVLAHTLRQLEPAADLQQRGWILLLLGVGGAIAGLLLSSDARRSDRRHPRDVLRAVSTLTTGIFAVLVTLTFLHSGLDPARTFSSRLSTSLTILVASVSVPGWLAHLLWQPGRGRSETTGKQP